MTLDEEVQLVRGALLEGGYPEWAYQIYGYLDDISAPTNMPDRVWWMALAVVDLNVCCWPCYLHNRYSLGPAAKCTHDRSLTSPRNRVEP